jgi:hypothetical protein
MDEKIRVKGDSIKKESIHDRRMGCLHELNVHGRWHPSLVD